MMRFVCVQLAATRFVTALGLFVLPGGMMLTATQLRAATAWGVKDALYRAVFKLKDAPADADTGIVLALPEFGQTRVDMGDLLLTDASGAPQPLAAVYSRPGSKAFVLAKTMLPGEEYFLYCGGGRSRSGPTWLPKVSVFLETRPVSPGAHCDSWADMDSLWRRTIDKCDGSFVQHIYHSDNPYGQDAGFISHYSGYINPPDGNTVALFTVSADASFVLVNDHFEFGWPGKHAGDVMPNDLRGKSVPRGKGPIKIDYYQIKGADDYPSAMVLGWTPPGGAPQTIPPDAWLHPGSSDLVRLEEATGQPVPAVHTSIKSYLGYGGEWYYLTEYSLRNDPPAGWTVTWQFDDGVTKQGTKGSRLLTGADPQMIQVKLARENSVITGTECVHFPNKTKRVKLEQTNNVRAYAELASADDPATIKPESAQARAILLLDFGTDADVAKFAPICLRADPVFASATTIRAFESLVYSQAEKDPKRALETLRALPNATREKYDDALTRLEIDLLVFYLHDPSAEGRANQLSFSRSNTETGHLMLVRAGDADRVVGKFEEAAARYQKANATRIEPVKVAAQDQAFSMTINNFLDSDHRDEAAAKVMEWELSHPQAKLTTDFLLLRARVAMQYGRWQMACTELESYAKMMPESPYQIDTQFYLAQAMAGAGQTAEARVIWAKIAKDYPKNPLAARSKALSEGKQP